MAALGDAVLEEQWIPDKPPGTEGSIAYWEIVLEKPKCATPLFLELWIVEHVIEVGRPGKAAKSLPKLSVVGSAFAGIEATELAEAEVRCRPELQVGGRLSERERQKPPQVELVVCR